MRFVIAPLAMAALLVATGCSRTSSSTVVDANGDWHRTVKFTISKGVGAGVGAESGVGQEWPNPFKLPTEAGWKKSESVKDDEKTITLSRDFHAGDNLLTDIVVRNEKTMETSLKNFVRVKEVETGVFEYYEKILNPNPAKESDQADIAKFQASLRAAMPAGITVEDAEVTAISKKMAVSIARIMFGPDDHLVGSFITNPEGTIRRLKLRLGKFLDAGIKETLAAKLSDDQRKAVVTKLMQEIDAESFKESKKAQASSGDGSDGSLMGMSVSVKVPGEIISSNGEIDPYTGEVFWDFLSATAELEPLELRVKFRVKK